MTLALAPALTIAATVGASVVIRRQPAPIRLAIEAVLVLGIGGVLLAMGSTPLPTSNGFHGTAGGWLRGLAVIWWLVAARLGSGLTVMALGHDARSRAARLVSDLVSGGIYLTAIGIVLNSILDLPVRGLVATSGVVAIVLGLALQNTLADLFAGIAVGLEQPFAIGDHIAVGTQEGVVVEMNWRAVRVQTDSADVVTVPNSIVAKSEVVNRSRPTERRAVTLEIPIRTAEPTGRVLELIEQALLLCPDVLTDPPASITLKAFDLRRTTFGVSYSVSSSARMGTARGQVFRQVRRLLRHGGVEERQKPGLADILGELALFANLTLEQRDRLADAAVHLQFEPGSVVFEQGSVGASLYVTMSGVLEMSAPSQSGSRSLGRVGPGEYMGEISMMTGDPRRVTLTALTSSEIAKVPRSAVQSLLVEDPHLAHTLESSVRRGAALLDRDEAARLSHPVEDQENLLRRLRRFLHGSSVGDGG